MISALIDIHPESPPANRREIKTERTILTVLLAMALFFPLVLASAMDKGLGHDEHQHIAAGALLLRHGLLPYRDFPYFHTPHLVFVYAGLFQINGHLLLMARIFSAICTTLTAGAIFVVAWLKFREWSRTGRVIGSAAAVALLITTPVYLKSTGNAWNQEPSILCALLSFLLVLAAPHVRRSSLLFFGAGCFLGLAVGFRLTFAPIALPLLCIIGVSSAGRLRWVWLAWFSLGATLALGPLWWLFIVAPEQTFFANFQFPKINVLYRIAAGDRGALTLPEKLSYIGGKVAIPNALLVIGVVASLGWYAFFSRRNNERFPLMALAALMPFVFAGSIAPSPLFEQYFYAPVPFLIVGMIFGSAPLFACGRSGRVTAVVLAGAVLVSVILAAPEYRDDLKFFLRPTKWKTVRVHGRDLAKERVGDGLVLTLSPTEVLEAGMNVYPAFSTGPFAWRVAPFIETAKRHRFGIVGADDLEEYLKPRPPSAVFTGSESAFEASMENFAKVRGLVRCSVDGKHEVWLAPVSD